MASPTEATLADTESIASTVPDTDSNYTPTLVYPDQQPVSESGPAEPSRVASPIVGQPVFAQSSSSIDAAISSTNTELGMASSSSVECPSSYADLRKQWDDEFEEMFPTYKLNNIEPVMQEDDELEPPKKYIRVEHVGLPPHAFASFSTSLGARASMQFTGSSAFAFGAACKQALCGGLERTLVNDHLAEQLSPDIQLVTKASLNRIMATPGMTVVGGKGEDTREMCDLIQKKAATHEFYIGISERPVERFLEHQASGYGEMHVSLHPDSKSSGDMEKCLINKWQSHVCCMNRGPGGLRASGGKPHFCYIVFRPQSLMR